MQQRLNYNHLLYFWSVAHAGSIAKASKTLALSQPAISTQIKLLEEALGEPLFTRVGKGLVLTEAGQLALRYADEIFQSGRELVDVLQGRPGARTLKLSVGIADVLPKLVAHRLLAPVLALSPPVRMVCLEDSSEHLLSALARHELDVVLSDVPVGGALRVRAFNHVLGDSATTFFATATLAAELRRGFPQSLMGAPLLLPTEDSVARRALDQWFERLGIRPDIIGEFEDSALMKVFGQQGAGVFAGPSVIEREVRRQYQVQVVGRTAEVQERYYAITVERRIRHPAVAALSEAARTDMFARQGATRRHQGAPSAIPARARRRAAGRLPPGARA